MQTVPLKQKVLMASPESYRIEYAINEFMRDESGRLNVVDSRMACDQWEGLKALYERVGIQVDVVESIASCPDMVYSANHALPFWDIKSNEPAVIMAKMANEERQPEVEVFEQWYRANGYQVFHLDGSVQRFEGMGDAILHPGRAKLWGGVGPRTQREAYAQIARITGYDVELLELATDRYYHLDTCFAILDKNTVVYLPDAFSETCRKAIEQAFSNKIVVSEEENGQYMLCNCFCPNGKDVIVQKGSERFVKDVSALSFTVHEVETGEFIKGGGSVFCLKMAVY